VSHPIVERILSGQAPDQVKQAAARGALPIPREDLIEVWILLRTDPNDEVRLACKESLAEVTEQEWTEVLPDHPFDPRVLDFAIRILGKNKKIRDAALRNSKASNETLEWFAQHARDEGVDMLLDNQIRLIESPSIVVALLANPDLSPNQVRRIFDMAEQFFRDNPEIPSLLELRFGLKLGLAGGEFERPGGEEDEIEVTEAPAEAPEEAEGALPEELLKLATSEEPLPQENFRSLYQQILQMPVPAKMELALKGNKEARTVLIRDNNKVVQESVLDSPKLTDGEVETFARMRNLPPDLFRKMVRNADWMKRYAVIKGLVFNPKVPPGLAIPLISRLMDLDLKLLVKDKNVRDVVRREAKKLHEIRHNKKTVSYKK
jgi:hypothetical protein